MTVVHADPARSGDFRLNRNIDWWDDDAECTVVLSQPAVDPSLWAEYLTGARRSYHRHGVDLALDFDAIRGGADTALFWAVVDPSGHVVGGVRAIGPLRAANESHAVAEWAGQPGERVVHKMISDRIPFGVLEMKSAWIAEEGERSRWITKAIARSGFHAMPLLDAQFCMATGATEVLERWRSSGGVVASAVPATPYPDARYRTKLMWWDRRTFAQHGQPAQVAKILTEIVEITKRSDTVASAVADGSTL